MLAKPGIGCNRLGCQNWVVHAHMRETCKNIWPIDVGLSGSTQKVSPVRPRLRYALARTDLAIDHFSSGLPLHFWQVCMTGPTYFIAAGGVAMR
jgi:hypothetical protein